LALANGLRRVRDAPPQAGSDLAARARNVRGAFAATMRHDGLAVAIVDDVMTTGATLAAAAAAMRDSGATRVEAWVVARTPPPKAR
jgi:predicted amidophosphoribosyltransferase